ncbi:Uncharacterized protein Fot_24602 [Forsythia ovata]|uniref:Uncharacterized protein n=1 Tax=Forsythia ovata TaxID=205694 RepID=A0ABD1U6N5_9LAMI
MKETVKMKAGKADNRKKSKKNIKWQNYIPQEEKKRFKSTLCHGLQRATRLEELALDTLTFQIIKHGIAKKKKWRINRIEDRNTATSFPVEIHNVQHFEQNHPGSRINCLKAREDC